MTDGGMAVSTLARHLREMSAGLDLMPDCEGAPEEPPGPRPAAIVVMREFHAAALARGALVFALGLSPAVRELWASAFTRTIFLAGNPRNLAARFTFAHVGEDARCGWLAPDERDASKGLRRLLRLFRAPAPVAAVVPESVELGTDGRHAARRELHVDVTGSAADAYLVQVHHALAESVLRGLVGPADRLVLVHHEGIDRTDARCDYARVDFDADGRLRTNAYLTEPLDAR
jgi:hypothetical protein